MFFVSLTEWTFQNVILRMVTALVLGGLIGIDRGAKKRGGGARTDAVVCLGAALVMITAQYMSVQFPGGTDIARMAAQVVSGVGFLGAGSIIVSGHQVKGLTYAASIWLCACVGLAAGIGFVDGAVLVTVVLIVGLHILPYVEDKAYFYSRYACLFVEVENSQMIPALLSKLKADGCKVDVYEVDDPRAGGHTFTIRITIRIPRKVNKQDYLTGLSKVEGVTFVDVV